MSALSTHAALLELVIHARERGELGDERLLRACRKIEERVAILRERQRRKLPSHRCARCERGTKGELLCTLCRGEAPAGIRQAFRNADGLDGMRRATRLVLAWARSEQEERRAA